MLLEARVAQPITEVEAVRLAHELYGLETTARALPGEYDDNFHLTSADGQAFVLRMGGARTGLLGIDRTAVAASSPPSST